MRRRRFSSDITSLVVALLLTAAPGFAADWSGDITTHVTWEAYSSISIVGNVTVTSSGWLTVEEGVAIDGSTTGTLDVEPGGQLEIGESGGAAVTFENMLSMTLDDCEGTTPITNVEFNACGDPNGVNPFITLIGGEDDGYVFSGCTFSEISSSTIHFDEDSRGGVGTCGWFQWADSPIVVGPSGGAAPLYVSIENNEFDGSILGWFQWADSPIIDAPSGGGSPINVVIEDNDFLGLSNSGIGIYVGGALHDDGLGAGESDITIARNCFYDLDIGVELGEGAEAGSILVCNNVFHNGVTGISVTSTSIDPVLAKISNNALFDNSTGVYVSLDGSSIPDGLSITNTVAWENAVGFDFGFANNASLDDVLFRNNVAGESGTAGFRSNVAVGQGAIHHMGLKSNTSNIKVGANDGSADRFANDCVIATGGGPYFSLVNEDPSSSSWDFRLLVDDTWSGDYNNLINAGYGTDPDGYTSDIGLFGGAGAAGNIDASFDVMDNYRSVTSIEFFNDLTAWEPDVYRVNISSPSINMSHTSTIDGGSAQYPTIVEVASGVALLVSDNFDVEYAHFRGINGSSWKGFKFLSYSSIDYSGFSNCTIQDADYGLYLSSLDDAGGDRLEVVDCIFTSCGNGVYANQSRLHLDGVTITGSHGSTYGGSGIYLTSCSSGKVLIENCTISGNGTGSTYSSAGIYMSNSSPEIYYTLIEDNSGAGVSCLSSTPDLNTWDSGSSSDRPNSIHSNGTGSQSGSNGSEIYLAYSSYPDIQYNNVWDYDGGPVGYMIYKHSTTNTSGITPSNNWWGATPTSSFFYWGGGSPIDYSTYSGSQLSSVQIYNLAMNLWNLGDFGGAANLFAVCVRDGGAIGINSVHYLSGCYAQIQNSNYAVLRTYLNSMALANRDPNVRNVIRRFATDCLTEMGEYDEALAEYQEAIDEAGCEADAIMAEIDWLSVYDIAHGDESDAISLDIPGRMTRALARLEEIRGGSDNAPISFELVSVYPNPFNSTARISFALPNAADLSVTVHDVAGREVARLFEGRAEAGHHSAFWQAGDAAAGVYLVKLDFDGTIRSARVTLVK